MTSHRPLKTADVIRIIVNIRLYLNNYVLRRLDSHCSSCYQEIYRITQTITDNSLWTCDFRNFTPPFMSD